ncbi:hypothetical protein ACFWWC_47615 [Streptomyces sp. NPDC058642]|uniref:hypothetical protein n=1 Tax=Streptomyces sp. NPDC058642 TaxID=3346572 RepID=UPI003660C360
MLSSAPRIVKVTVTLISDPPLFNILGAHPPCTPVAIVETEISDGVVGIGGTCGSRDHPEEEIAAVHALVSAGLHDQPACTNGSTGRRHATKRLRCGHAAQAPRPGGATAPAVVTAAGQNPTHEGEQ